ncbi:hypothetical protein CD178_03414 (plasmid) [Komagataeibacter saccharivorans]|uniref:Uncharacterized protein n=1 Tax=Komagataeibacter saccharivorans TaxID=265959 RepID=A0A347WH15_9PROT|nr:hypothetical protein CD178_03414 [Komagataeibacter saccharivorans]
MRHKGSLSSDRKSSKLRVALRVRSPSFSRRLRRQEKSSPLRGLSAFALMLPHILVHDWHDVEKRHGERDASSTTLTRLRRVRVARCGDYGRASSFSVTVSRPGRQDGLRPRFAASRPSRRLCRPAPDAGQRPAAGAGRPACSGRFGPDSLSVPPSCPGAGCGSQKRLHPLHYRHRHGRSPPRTPAGYGLVKRHLFICFQVKNIRK